MAKWFLQQITHAACNIPVFTKHRPIFFKTVIDLENRDANPRANAKFPQVFYSQRCSIPTGAPFPKVAHLGLGAGAGGWGWGWGWVLLGPMGLWCPRGCQKLYVLVRKPLAALHSAAGEPLRHASNKIAPPNAPPFLPRFNLPGAAHAA